MDREMTTLVVSLEITLPYPTNKQDPVNFSHQNSAKLVF